MKPLIIGLFLAMALNTCYAKAFSPNIQDSVYVPDNVDSLILQFFSHDLQLCQGPLYSATSTTLKADFFDMLWKEFTSLFKPVWGKYDEPGYKVQGPYTIFNTFKGDLPSQLDILRSKIIKKEDGHHLLYYSIYQNAVTGQTSTCPNDFYDIDNRSSVCPNVRTAKSAAFIYILGLKLYEVDANPNLLSPVDTFGLFSSGSERRSFKEKAQNIMKSVSPPGLDNWTVDMSSFYKQSLGAIALISAYEAIVFTNIFYRSKELLPLLQAFDMIRWGNRLDPLLDDEVNSPTTHKCADRLKNQYVQPIYQRTSIMFLLNRNNHTVITASALGMAAIVLNDYGGYKIFDWSNWPQRWANVANYNLHNVMWHEGITGPLSKKGAQYGFSEGDGYSATTLQLVLPYALAQYNFQHGDHTRAYYDYPIWTLTVFPNPFPKHVRTIFKDPDYDNIYKWQRNITMPSGKGPNLDDSWADLRFSGMLAIKGQTEDGESLHLHPSWDPVLLGSKQKDYDLTPDFLAAQNPAAPYHLYQDAQMPDGSTVLKTRYSLGDNKHANHYLLGLAEHGVALNSFWHEQYEPGHLTLAVDQDILLIDPAYYVSGDNDDLNNNNKDDEQEVRRFMNHNIIYHGYDYEEDINDGNYDIKVSPIMPINKSYTMTITTHDSWLLGGTHGAAIDSRTIKVFSSPEYFYYLVDDNCKSDNDHNEVRFNGNSESNYTNSNGKAKWNYPCVINSARWGLTAETGVTSNTPDYNSYSVNFHGAHDGSLDPAIERSGSNSWGEHHTFVVKNTDKKKVRFLTKLTPYRCSTGENTHVTISNTDHHTLLYAKIGKKNGTDTIHNYHFGRDPVVTSTVTSGLLQMNAETGFFSWDEDTVVRNKNCISYTHFRKAGIDNGYYIEYDNDVYISSDQKLDAYYELSGKFKYHGYINSTSSSHEVTFMMPDLEKDYLMIAKDATTGELLETEHEHTDPYLYNRIIVTFTKKNQEFILELADPCLVSCFFPSTLTTIDTLFDFYEGTTETLGHNLDIIRNEGRLHIRDGSKASICSGYYLFNQDSITMISEERIEEKYPLYAAEEDLPGGGTGIADTSYLKRFGSKRSMIIVNDQAALILDSGSYTHVGGGSTILIRKGGTLYIKKGATLEIGNALMTDFGEVIAEAGSYICVEDSSDLHFFVNPQDSSAKNIFFIPVDMGVFGEVNMNGINNDFDGGRFDGPHNCLPLCSLWYYMEEDGVNNPVFGTNSVGRPHAEFRLPMDTICTPLDTIIYIDASHSRNGLKYRISAKRADNSGGIYYREQQGNYQALTKRELIDLTSLGLANGTININLTVENNCGDTDFYSRSMYIPQPAIATFTLNNDTACNGYGTVTADGSASSSGLVSIRHIWSVYLIDTNTYTSEDTFQIAYGAEWQLDSVAVNDSFDFPGFRWRGGFRYMVGLTVYGACGLESEFIDTVAVPLGVYITANSLKSSNSYVGNFGIELNGIITGPYNTFTWDPEGELDNASILNPITTTRDSIAYTLTAYDDHCTATDTFIVTHRNTANLGDDRVVCAGDDIVVGNGLEASLLLALIGYTDRTYYEAYFDSIENIYPSFGKNMTRFLYMSEFVLTDEFNYCWEPFMAFVMEQRNKFYHKSDYPVYFNYFQTQDISYHINKFTLEFMDEHDDLDDLYKDYIALNGNSTFVNTLRTCTKTLVEHIIDNYSGDPGVSAEWYINNAYHSPDNGWFMVKKQINEPTTFGLLVTMDEKAEYDVVTIYTDTLARPAFSVFTQTDSTVYFSNNTIGSVFGTTYLWTFGDGDSSTDINSIHTFAAFDSTYVVCLFATNTCGTEQYCDTITVDSFTLQIYTNNKKGSGNGPAWEQTPAKQTVTALSGKNMLGNNIPNPFDQLTRIDYELALHHKSAQIIVTNPLGQTVEVIPLPHIKGTIVIDGSKLGSGMYYYSLVVDDILNDTKIMVIK